MSKSIFFSFMSLISRQLCQNQITLNYPHNFHYSMERLVKCFPNLEMDHSRS